MFADLSAEQATGPLRPEYVFLRTEHSHVARICALPPVQDGVADILICPGYPGKQNMASLGRHFAHHGLNVHLPLHPGTAHVFDGVQNEIFSPTSFFDAHRDIRTYLKTEFIAKDKPVILGALSIGTVLAAALLDEFLDSIRGLFVLSGIYNVAGFFRGTDYVYGSHPGWKGLARFFHDCYDRQTVNDNVPVQGSPQRAFSEFREMVYREPDLSDLLLPATMPVVVVHSRADRVVPYASVKDHFPRGARVICPEMDHALFPLTIGSPDPQAEIARELAGVFGSQAADRVQAVPLVDH